MTSFPYRNDIGSSSSGPALNEGKRLRIFAGVLNWFAGRQVDPSFSDILAPDDLDFTLLVSRLSEQDRLRLMTRVALSLRYDESRQDVVLRLHRALSIPDDYWNLLQHRITPLFDQVADQSDFLGILVAPPPELEESVDALIEEFTADREPKPLPGLRAIHFQHPVDRSMRRTLENIPAIPSLIARLGDAQRRALELHLRGNGVRVTERSLPTLYRTYRHTCDLLGMTGEPPPLYVAMGPANAFCAGCDEPLLTVSSDLLNLLDPREQAFVLGHELGHALCSHSKYHAVAGLLVNVSSGLLSKFTLGASELLAQTTIAPLIFAWVRRSEFTADRAGFLACQDRDSALRAMLKMAGLPWRYFHELSVASLIEQAEEYQQALNASATDRINDVFLHLGSTHPLWTDRATELLRWVNAGWGQELIGADAQRLRNLEQALSADPVEVELLVEQIQILTDWVSDRFAVDRVLAGKLLRRAIIDGRTLAGSPLSPILQIESRTTPLDSDNVRFELVVLFVEGQKPLQVTLPVHLSTDSGWMNVPSELRREFWTTGATTKTKVIYSRKGGS